MCASMTPIIKNGWQLYHTDKIRHTSSTSQKLSQNKALPNKRIGELRSASFNVPANEYEYNKPLRSFSLRNSCNSSRASFTVEASRSSTPSRSKKLDSSKSSLHNFQNKLKDKLKNLTRGKSKEEVEEQSCAHESKDLS